MPFGVTAIFLMQKREKKFGTALNFSLSDTEDSLMLQFALLRGPDTVLGRLILWLILRMTWHDGVTKSN